MTTTNENNIIQMNNLDKYNSMITYLVNKEFLQLSIFLQPWIDQQKYAKTEIYKGHTLFVSNGNYFEFLRWLVFQMIKEHKYINQETYSLIIYFENGMDLTGIFRIKEGGLLHNLLSSDDIFNYTNDIITISNSQLVIYIDTKLKLNKNGGKKTTTNKLTHTKMNKLTHTKMNKLTHTKMNKLTKRKWKKGKKKGI